MEAAATPLRNPRVSALIGRVIIEHLVVDDALAAELVRARADAGEDPARLIADAIEIGARVLDREQAGASVEILKGGPRARARSPWCPSSRRSSSRPSGPTTGT